MESIDIYWASGGRNGSASLDRGELERLTHDGRSVGETAAGLIARRLLQGMETSGELRLRIVTPAGFAGLYAVAYAFNEKSRQIGTNAHTLDETASYECGMWHAAARLTAPEDVPLAYELLGNICGHRIDMPRTPGRWTDADVEAMRKAYDDAVFHGMGWPAFCRTSGRVGLLASFHRSDCDIHPLSDAARAFHRETGCTIQSMEADDLGGSLTVCFIPVENADVLAASRTLERFLSTRIRAEHEPPRPR